MRDQESVMGFQEMLAQPEDTLLALLRPGQNVTAKEIKSKLRKTCRYLFNEVEELSKAYLSLKNKAEEESPGSLSGLDQLFTGPDEQPVDAETLWGQIEIQNTALHPLLKKSLKHVVKTIDVEKNEEVRLLDLGGVLSEEEEMEVHNSDVEEDDGSSSSDASSSEEKKTVAAEDKETLRIRKRMEQAMANMEDSDNSDNDQVLDKVQNENEAGEESLADPAAEELNNGFFDIHEMEAFADEEEDYLPEEAFGAPREDTQKKGKKSFHQRQREGDIESTDESDVEDEAVFGGAGAQPLVRRRKYREDDEIEELYKLYDTPESDDDEGSEDVINMSAADFFGMPNKKYFHKWRTGNSTSLSKQSDNNYEDDNDSWDDHDFDKNETSGWRDPNDRNDKEEDHDSDNRDDTLDEDSGGSSKPNIVKKSDRLLRQTEQLEKDMLAEKPWQMTGETKSTSRPVNSLLEATPEFEVATKMAPIITVEHTSNLEEVIKRRILNEDWDDVIPRELPDIGWNKNGSEAPEVSQEKSKLGLGELYEREYLKKAVGYDVDAVEKQTEEEKAKNEMKALFANLCSKLDALSNYHFAPRPISGETEVRPVSTPAIAMEEVMPLHVSDARGVAPEEVYGKKRGRDGVLRGETEFDQMERKRLRGSKKTARRKKRKEKLADEKLISRLEPGLGLNKPYQKRKQREELSIARAQGKVTTGEVDVNADYGASGKFFKRMQEEVEHSVRGEGRPEKTVKPQKHGQKSSAFKL